MCKKLVCLLMVLSFASVASATHYFTAGMDGSTWEDTLNWTPTSLPGSLDNARIRNNVTGKSAVISSAGMECAKLQLSYTTSAPSTVTINSGGVLTCQGSVEVYVGAGYVSSVTINAGGTFNACKQVSTTIGAFKIGRSSAGGTHTVTVAGNLNIEGVGAENDAELMLNTNPAMGGGAQNSSTLDILNGGLVVADQMSINWDTLDGDVDLKVSGTGKLKVHGNKALDWLYIAKAKGGILYGNGIANAVMISYDGTDTILEVPEPATIAMLGLGGLALIRKRR